MQFFFLATDRRSTKTVISILFFKNFENFKCYLNNLKILDNLVVDSAPWSHFLEIHTIPRSLK